MSRFGRCRNCLNDGSSIIIHWSNCELQHRERTCCRELRPTGSQSVCLHEKASTHPPTRQVLLAIHADLNWRRRSVLSVITFTVTISSSVTIATVASSVAHRCSLHLAYCYDEPTVHLLFLYLFQSAEIRIASCVQAGKQKVAIKEEQFPWTLPKFHPEISLVVFTRVRPIYQLPSPSPTCHPACRLTQSATPAESRFAWNWINWIKWISWYDRHITHYIILLHLFIIISLHLWDILQAQQQQIPSFELCFKF